MPIYRIADFLWDIEPKYALVPRICEKYLAPDQSAAPDFSIRILDETIALAHADVPQSSVAYAESICIYRALCDQASAHGAMLLHAATVKVGEHAYAFSAPSGTGKSTHIRLWRRVYGERIRILNGDKPILREKDGKLIAYGTPWCGKEGWNSNDEAPLGALCFVTRGENSIRRMTAAEAVDRVFGQLLKPTHADGVAQTLRLTDLLLRTVPLYLLSCDISEEAARLSFETMTAPYAF